MPSVTEMISPMRGGRLDVGHGGDHGAHGHVVAVGGTSLAVKDPSCSAWPAEQAVSWTLWVSSVVVAETSSRLEAWVSGARARGRGWPWRSRCWPSARCRPWSATALTKSPGRLASRPWQTARCPVHQPFMAAPQVALSVRWAVTAKVSRVGAQAADWSGAPVASPAGNEMPRPGSEPMPMMRCRLLMAACADPVGDRTFPVPWSAGRSPTRRIFLGVVLAVEHLQVVGFPVFSSAPDGPAACRPDGGSPGFHCPGRSCGPRRSQAASARPATKLSSISLMASLPCSRILVQGRDLYLQLVGRQQAMFRSAMPRPLIGRSSADRAAA